MNETQRLKDSYGYPDGILKKYKVLNNSFIINERKWIGTNYQFMLKMNKEEKKYIYVYLILKGNFLKHKHTGLLKRWRKNWCEK